jgi:hypothetical protein
MRSLLFALLIYGGCAVELQSGCFIDPKGPGTTYKYGPGQVFPSDPTHSHGLRLVADAAHCCTLCQSLKNCSFFTYAYSDGGVVGKPRCNSTEGQGCCFLQTAAGGKNPGHGCDTCISGSTKALNTKIIYLPLGDSITYMGLRHGCWPTRRC